MSTYVQQWRPAADVYVTPTTVEVTLEAAGIAGDEIHVALVGGTMVIEGRRRLPDDIHPHGVYHAVEIRRGEFRVEISLPAPVEATPRSVQSQMGLLVVSFKKRGFSDGCG